MIGCGAMAGAMLTRWIDTGLDPASVTVIDPATQRSDVRVLRAIPQESAPAMLMLGVKPQMLGDLVPALQAASNEAVVISILAGTTTATLARLFPQARSILRVIPNLPVAIGKGVVALHGNLDAADHATVAKLMAPLGLVEWIVDERLFDAVTALSGSGPAFVYRFIDALTRGGTALGLSTEQSARLAIATVEGAALLAARSDEPPAMLADQVASKGGSTRMGLDIFDERDALVTLTSAALAAAQARNRELAAISPSG